MSKLDDAEEVKRAMEIPGIKETFHYFNQPFNPLMSKHKGRHHMVNVDRDTMESQQLLQMRTNMIIR